MSKGADFGSAREQIELAYSEAKVWFQANGLSLNDVKMQRVIFSLKKNEDQGVAK